MMLRGHHSSICRIQDNYGAVVNKVSVGSRPGLDIASLSLAWSSDFLAVLDCHVLWNFDKGPHDGMSLSVTDLKEYSKGYNFVRLEEILKIICPWR